MKRIKGVESKKFYKVKKIGKEARDKISAVDRDISKLVQNYIFYPIWSSTNDVLKCSKAKDN